MARMLGDRLLPESVQSRRRQLRQRAQNLRDPIRNRRENLVPGPDVFGRAESTASDLRDRFVQRDGVVSRIRARRNGNDNSGNGNSNGNGSGDEDPREPNTSQMT